MNIEEPDELRDYLISRNLLGDDGAAAFEPLKGGVSNRTMLVRIGKDSWVLKQALSKLRVAADWRCDPKRIHREANGLRHLEYLLPKGCVPKFVFEDDQQHLLAMTEVPRPHANWKSLLLADGPSKRHIEQAAILLGALHVHSALDAENLREEFSDTSYFEDLRLEPYYSYTAEQLPAARDFLSTLVAETRKRPTALVHGDFSPKNVLIHADHLVLLDHEVIHWGDPAFDCGFFLAHLISKAHHVVQHRQAFADAAIRWWNRYWREVGGYASKCQDRAVEPLVVEERAVRHTVACLLARVSGRSPLEYLNPTERSRQRAAVLSILKNCPSSIDSLVGGFIDRMETTP